MQNWAAGVREPARDWGTGKDSGCEPEQETVPKGQGAVVSGQGRGGDRAASRHPPAGDCCAPVPAGSAAAAPGRVPSGCPAAPPGAAAAPAEPPSRPPASRSAQQGRGLAVARLLPLARAPCAHHGPPLTLRSTSMSRPLCASVTLGAACSWGSGPTGPWRSCKERPWEVTQGSGGTWGWHRGLNQWTLSPQPSTPGACSSVTFHPARAAFSRLRSQSPCPRCSFCTC